MDLGGFKPTISSEVDDPSSLVGLVAAGHGVAIVTPEHAAFAQVTRIRISQNQARREIGVAWSKNRYLSTMTRAFRDFALQPKDPDLFGID